MFLRRIFLFVPILTTTLSGCEYCETQATITFDNTRAFCNCDIEFPNGDEYVVFAGESQTYDLNAGRHTFHINCGETAYGNTFLCFLENGERDFSFDVDCEDQLYLDLDF